MADNNDNEGHEESFEELCSFFEDEDGETPISTGNVEGFAGSNDNDHAAGPKTPESVKSYT